MAHKWVPFTNCYSKDRSKCELQDIGNFKAIILQVIQGDIKKGKFNFTPSYCAKQIPNKDGIYFFYGNTLTTYNGHFTKMSVIKK